MSKNPETLPAHTEIEVVAQRVIGLYQQQHDYLASKSDAYLEELLHRSEDNRNHVNFSTRVGAEVNLCAASMVLQKRSLRTANVQNKEGK